MGGRDTSVLGAGFGAALGAIIIYLAEILAKVDIPSAVEGSILVVVTGLVAYLIPSNRDQAAINR